jgi:hypothetical protein
VKYECCPFGLLKYQFIRFTCLRGYALLLMVVKPALLAERDYLRLAFLLAHLTKWHTSLHTATSALGSLVAGTRHGSNRRLENWLTSFPRLSLDSYLTGLYEHKQKPAIQVLSTRNRFMGEEIPFSLQHTWHRWVLFAVLWLSCSFYWHKFSKSQQITVAAWTAV